MIYTKKGKLYLRFLTAAAVLFILASAIHTLAANPSAVPGIVTDANGSTENVTQAFATNQIFRKNEVCL